MSRRYGGTVIIVVIWFFNFVSVLLIGEEENRTLHNDGRPEESECGIFDSVVCGEFTLTVFPYSSSLCTIVSCGGLLSVLILEPECRVWVCFVSLLHSKSYFSTNARGGGGRRHQHRRQKFSCSNITENCVGSDFVVRFCVENKELPTFRQTLRFSYL